MRQIIASAFVSLDGVMQAPGGQDEDRSGGFRFGGWTAPTGMTPLRKRWAIFFGAVRSAAGAAHLRHFRRLLAADHRRGRSVFRRYRPRIQSGHQVRRHPPRRDAGVAEQPVAGRDIIARLRELKRTQGPVLLVQGSSTLMQQLLANDLLDELRLLTYPVLLGGGKRLFDDNAAPAAFTLAQSVVSPGGVIVAHYAAAAR